MQQLEQRPELIDRYITEKIRSGLSPKTVTNQQLVLRVLLKTAVRWRLMQRNPVTDCERPRLEQPEMRILSEHEIAQLCTPTNNSPETQQVIRRRPGGDSHKR